VVSYLSVLPNSPTSLSMFECWIRVGVRVWGLSGFMYECLSYSVINSPTPLRMFDCRVRLRVGVRIRV